MMPRHVARAMLALRDRQRAGRPDSGTDLAQRGDTLRGMPKFRLLDTAGSEIAIIDDPRTALAVGDLVRHPDGRALPVLDVYDEDDGLEGGVNATVVVEENE
jgi:hypothetical protein